MAEERRCEGEGQGLNGKPVSSVDGVEPTSVDSVVKKELSEQLVVSKNEVEVIEKVVRTESSNVPPKGTGGRKRDPIWSEFKRLDDPDNGVEWYCKNCGCQVSAYANRLRDHFNTCVLLHGSVCTKVKTAGRRKSSIWSKFEEVKTDGEGSESKWFCKICDHRVSAYAPRLKAHYDKCITGQTQKRSNHSTPIHESIDLYQDAEGEDDVDSTNAFVNCDLCGLEYEYGGQDNARKGHFSIWAIDCADSLCQVLQLNSSHHLKALRAGVYCNKCIQLTRDLDFLLRSIRALQTRLTWTQTQIEKLVKRSGAKKLKVTTLAASTLLSAVSFSETHDSELHDTVTLLQRKRKLVQEKRGKLHTDILRSIPAKRSRRLAQALEKIDALFSPNDIVITKMEPESIKEEEPVNFSFEDDQTDDPDFNPLVHAQESESHQVSPCEKNDISPSEKGLSDTSDEEWNEKRTKKRLNMIPFLKKRGKRGRPRKYLEGREILKSKRSGKYVGGKWGAVGCTFEACTFRCNKPENLAVHFRSAHLGDPTPHHCTFPNCERKFRQYESLYYHKKWHEKGGKEENFVRCPVSNCSKRCWDETTLKKHLAWRHHGYNRPRCQFCGLTFPQGDQGTTDMELHEAKHKDSTVPYSCVVADCSVSFTNFLDLKKHVAAGHEETTLFCEFCPEKNFRNFLTLRAHKNRVHAAVPKRGLKCDQSGCNFEALNKSTLRNHIKTHMIERPHMCDTCGSTYKTAGALKRHQFTHTGETPYKCKYCSKSFNMSQKLKNHEETHAPNLTYLCSGCGKAFRSKKNLYQHVNFHCPTRPPSQVAKKSPPRKRKGKRQSRGSIGVQLEEQEPGVTDYSKNMEDPSIAEGQSKRSDETERSHLHHFYHPTPWSEVSVAAHFLNHPHWSQ